MTTAPETGFTDNAEAIEAWDGPLFERFTTYRHIVVAGLKNHGDEALRLYPPAPGAQVIDLGCGFGDMTQQLAAHVGADGAVLGVDASPRFIAAAIAEADAADVANARFVVADVERDELGGSFDAAYSRFGTMFFAQPVQALRNVRSALVPGGRLVMVVWRAKVENDWMYRAQQVTERFVTKPDDYDEPTCGPGPFSLGNADTVSGILVSAGFADITLHRCDLPIMIGSDLDEAVSLLMNLGPAGEILRLAGDRGAHLHGAVSDALHEALAPWAGPDGVVAPASTWIVSAQNPG
jgi:SAM-dependent methyltransferase